MWAVGRGKKGVARLAREGVAEGKEEMRDEAVSAQNVAEAESARMRAEAEGRAYGRAGGEGGVPAPVTATVTEAEVALVTGAEREVGTAVATAEAWSGVRSDGFLTVAVTVAGNVPDDS